MTGKLLLLNFQLVYRFDRWVKRRFTATGLALLAGLVAAGIFGVNTRQTLSYQMCALLACLLVAAMLCAPFFRGRFSLRRTLPRYATAGEPVFYSAHVENLTRHAATGLTLTETLSVRPPTYDEFRRVREPGSRRRNWFDHFVGYPRWAWFMRQRTGAQAVPADVPDMGPGETVEVRMRLLPLRRGRVRLGEAAVSRADPLGLFRAIVRVPASGTVLVLPRRYAVAALPLAGERDTLAGTIESTLSTGGADEFAALREYRPGDPLRRIDWKGWARLGFPIVREFHERSAPRQALVLDTFYPTGPDARFEAAVSVAASLVCTQRTGSAPVALVYADGACSSGNGTGADDLLLEALACVQPRSDGLFAGFSRQVVEFAVDAGSVVCVLLDWDRQRQQLVAAVRATGADVLVLLIAGGEIPQLPDSGPLADQPGRLRVLTPETLERDLANLSVSVAGVTAAAA